MLSFGSYMDKVLYPDLDMASVFNTPKEMDPVVFCDTNEDALHFLAVMKRCYPQYCETWNFPNTRFNEYGSDGIGYRIIRRENCRRMQYAGHNFYWQEISDGEPYVIIQYSDLIVCSEIDVSELPIESLFGLEV